MNKKRFPSSDVSLGISAEKMVVGGSLNVSLDPQASVSHQPSAES